MTEPPLKPWERMMAVWFVGAALAVWVGTAIAVGRAW